MTSNPNQIEVRGTLGSHSNPILIPDSPERFDGDTIGGDTIPNTPRSSFFSDSDADESTRYNHGHMNNPGLPHDEDDGGFPHFAQCSI